MFKFGGVGRAAIGRLRCDGQKGLARSGRWRRGQMMPPGGRGVDRERQELETGGGKKAWVQVVYRRAFPSRLAMNHAAKARLGRARVCSGSAVQ
jgi:hypothetical protein